MAEFLVLLLMSKFVMVTAVYVGFSMVAYGAIPGNQGMAVGIATLLLAAFSPMLFRSQGIRIGETSVECRPELGRRRRQGRHNPWLPQRHLQGRAPVGQGQ